MKAPPPPTARLRNPTAAEASVKDGPPHSGPVPPALLTRPRPLARQSSRQRRLEPAFRPASRGGRLSSDSAPRVRKADAVAGSAHDRTRLTLGASARARSAEPTGRARRRQVDRRHAPMKRATRAVRGRARALGFRVKTSAHHVTLRTPRVLGQLRQTNAEGETRTVNAKPTLGSEAI